MFPVESTAEVVVPDTVAVEVVDPLRDVVAPVVVVWVGPVVVAPGVVVVVVGVGAEVVVVPAVEDWVGPVVVVTGVVVL